jgi:protein-serine/threonine kinase
VNDDRVWYCHKSPPPTRDDRPYLVISARLRLRFDMSARRPLPPTPSMAHRSNQQYISQVIKDTGMDMYPTHYPYFAPNSVAHLPANIYDEPSSTLRGGTLLHKGFYDLLAMIPTPSPSRFFWGPSSPQPDPAGPRYEDIAPGPPPKQVAIAPPPPKKGRRISKDMVSNPTGFLYVSIIHTSHSCSTFLPPVTWFTPRTPIN